MESMTSCTTDDGKLLRRCEVKLKNLSLEAMICRAKRKIFISTHHASETCEKKQKIQSERKYIGLEKKITRFQKKFLSEDLQDAFEEQVTKAFENLPEFTFFRAAKVVTPKKTLPNVISKVNQKLISIMGVSSIPSTDAVDNNRNQVMQDKKKQQKLSIKSADNIKNKMDLLYHKKQKNVSIKRSSPESNIQTQIRDVEQPSVKTDSIAAPQMRVLRSKSPLIDQNLQALTTQKKAMIITDVIHTRQREIASIKRSSPECNIQTQTNDKEQPNVETVSIAAPQMRVLRSKSYFIDQNPQTLTTQKDAMIITDVIDTRQRKIASIKRSSPECNIQTQTNDKEQPYVETVSIAAPQMRVLSSKSSFIDQNPQTLTTQKDAMIITDVIDTRQRKIASIKRSSPECNIQTQTNDKEQRNVETVSIAAPQKRVLKSKSFIDQNPQTLTTQKDAMIITDVIDTRQRKIASIKRSSPECNIQTQTNDKEQRNVETALTTQNDAMIITDVIDTRQQKNVSIKRIHSESNIQIQNNDVHSIAEDVSIAATPRSSWYQNSQASITPNGVKLRRTSTNCSDMINNCGDHYDPKKIKINIRMNPRPSRNESRVKLRTIEHDAKVKEIKHLNPVTLKELCPNLKVFGKIKISGGLLINDSKNIEKEDQVPNIQQNENLRNVEVRKEQDSFVIRELFPESNENDGEKGTNSSQCIENQIQELSYANIDKLHNQTTINVGTHSNTACENDYSLSMDSPPGYSISSCSINEKLAYVLKDTVPKMISPIRHNEPLLFETLYYPLPKNYDVTKSNHLHLKSDAPFFIEPICVQKSLHNDNNNLVDSNIYYAKRNKVCENVAENIKPNHEYVIHISSMQNYDNVNGKSFQQQSVINQEQECSTISATNNIHKSPSTQSTSPRLNDLDNTQSQTQHVETASSSTEDSFKHSGEINEDRIISIFNNYIERVFTKCLNKVNISKELDCRHYAFVEHDVETNTSPVIRLVPQNHDGSTTLPFMHSNLFRPVTGQDEPQPVQELSQNMNIKVSNNDRNDKANIAHRRIITHGNIIDNTSVSGKSMNPPRQFENIKVTKLLSPVKQLPNEESCMDTGACRTHKPMHIVPNEQMQQDELLNSAVKHTEIPENRDDDELSLAASDSLFCDNIPQYSLINLTDEEIERESRRLFPRSQSEVSATSSTNPMLKMLHGICPDFIKTKCIASECKSLHKLHVQHYVLSKLNAMSDEDVFQSYQYTRKYINIFKKYCICFCRIFAKRKFLDELFGIAYDCYKYNCNLSFCLVRLLLVIENDWKMDTTEVLMRMFRLACHVPISRWYQWKLLFFFNAMTRRLKFGSTFIKPLMRILDTGRIDFNSDGVLLIMDEWKSHKRLDVQPLIKKLFSVFIH